MKAHRLRGPCPLGLCHSMQSPGLVTSIQSGPPALLRPLHVFCDTHSCHGGSVPASARSLGCLWCPSPATPGSRCSLALLPFVLGPTGDRAVPRVVGNPATVGVTRLRSGVGGQPRPSGKTSCKEHHVGPSGSRCPPHRLVRRESFQGNCVGPQRGRLVPVYPRLRPAAGRLRGRAQDQACVRPQLHEASCHQGDRWSLCPPLHLVQGKQQSQPQAERGRGWWAFRTGEPGPRCLAPCVPSFVPSVGLRVVACSLLGLAHLTWSLHRAWEDLGTAPAGIL